MSRMTKEPTKPNTMNKGIVVTLPDGRKIMFKDIAEASRKVGCNYREINRALTSEDHMYRGSTWRYLMDEGLTEDSDVFTPFNENLLLLMTKRRATGPISDIIRDRKNNTVKEDETEGFAPLNYNPEEEELREGFYDSDFNPNFDPVTGMFISARQSGSLFTSLVNRYRAKCFPGGLFQVVIPKNNTI